MRAGPVFACLFAYYFRWTGSDHVALIQQMHFVVGTDAGVIRDDATRRAFVQACLTVLTILIFLKKRSVSHEALTTLDYNCQQVGPVFTQLFRSLPEEFLMNLDIPKVC